MNFHPFEDTMNSIGVVVGKLFGLLPVLKLENQQASSLVGEGASEDDPPLFVEKI
jgi:hypothetical protein